LRVPAPAPRSPVGRAPGLRGPVPRSTERRGGVPGGGGGVPMTVPSWLVMAGSSPGGISLPVSGWVSELGRRRAVKGRFIRGPVRAAAAASPSSLEAARLLIQRWSIRVRSSATRS
ncbi:MAG TPA: hypothetical protein VJ010_07455, partial [Actinomycetota bacterium]|nr:hypothetical protein [Actinomycetota bacterium]